MGTRSWSDSDYAAYTCVTKSCSVDNFTTMSFSAQELYKSRKLADVLNPYKVMRECCDSEEHPNTTPIILALDCTGSMGGASVKVAQQLNTIMTDIYASGAVPDVEFCIMAIGDLAYDGAPIQMGQFESDIRIAEQLDQVYFEGGGGGNSYESYTAAWYMGLNHCKLDCWNRGKKGIIITLGDELPNPYLPAMGIKTTVGDNVQADIETKSLLPQVLEKFDVYHISVDDKESSYQWNNERRDLDGNWTELLGAEHYKVCNLNNLGKTITEIITSVPSAVATTGEGISW